MPIYKTFPKRIEILYSILKVAVTCPMFYDHFLFPSPNSETPATGSKTFTIKADHEAYHQ